MNFYNLWILPFLLFSSNNLNFLEQECNLVIFNEEKTEISFNEEFCNKPPDPQRTFDARFLPLKTDPEKILKVNFIFLGRPADQAKGIKASDERNSDYQAYIDEIIRIMNFQAGNFLHEQTDNQCSEVRIDSKIRYDIKKIFIQNAEYWNNENDSCTKGCPSLNNCEWYLNELNDSINQGLTDFQKRINIFFTENDGFYKEVEKGQILDVKKIETDCSMSYKTNLETDAKIHMRNELIAYKNKYWDAKARKIDYKTVLKWGHWGTARLIVHEIGHTIFGGGHINNKCNIMNGKNNYVQEHLRDQQLQEAHRALSTHNMRKYVKPTKGLGHEMLISGEETWDYDIQVWGNIVVEANSTLTISCKLRMPPLSKIELKKGGKLILDGGTILPAFKNTSWYGVQGISQNNGFFSKIFKRKSAENEKLLVLNGGQIILN